MILTLVVTSSADTASSATITSVFNDIAFAIDSSGLAT